jgi:hypothetical protein
MDIPHSIRTRTGGGPFSRRSQQTKGYTTCKIYQRERNGQALSVKMRTQMEILDANDEVKEILPEI